MRKNVPEHVSKKLRSFTSIGKPVTFLSPLSEAEVRMALKNLCGSAFDRSPFKGEVDEKTFLFSKNPPPFSHGFPRPVFVGELVRKNGNTQVTVSAKAGVSDLVGSILVCLFLLIPFGYLAFTCPNNPALSVAFVPAGFILSAAYLAIYYVFCYCTVRRSIAILKKALNV